MRQDDPVIDESQRTRHRNSLIFFALIVFMTFSSLYFAMLVLARKDDYSDYTLGTSLAFIFGHVFLFPILVTNSMQIVPKYRNAGSRVRIYFVMALFSFLLLLNGVAN